MTRVVLDTNVFVAAGFRARSSSRQILDLVREGAIRLVTDPATRRETQRILRRIPPLRGKDYGDLFDAAEQFGGRTHPARFGVVPDFDDRKFAALAEASGAILVTNDSDLLSVRARLAFPVKTPRELLSPEEGTT